MFCFLHVYRSSVFMTPFSISPLLDSPYAVHEPDLNNHWATVLLSFSILHCCKIFSSVCEAAPLLRCVACKQLQHRVLLLLLLLLLLHMAASNLHRLSGCAVAQGVSRWLPTAAARVPSPVWSSGICGGQCGAGVGFLRELRFPLPNSPSS
jgi:hypothetical protein